MMVGVAQRGVESGHVLWPVAADAAHGFWICRYQHSAVPLGWGFLLHWGLQRRKLSPSVA